MYKYSSVVVAGACAGGAVLAAVAVALIVLYRRVYAGRRSCRNGHPKNPSQEEAAASQAPIQIAVSAEAQPLLSESAIRTRYADSADEYARSLMERSSVGHGTFSSQPWALSRSPYNPLQNTVQVITTDSEDSDDSSFDSSPGGIAHQPAIASSQASSALRPAESMHSASCTHAIAAERESGPETLHSSRSHACSSASSQNVALAAPLRMSESGHPSSAADSAVCECPDYADTACEQPAGRPRCFTLNAQAKEFVPGGYTTVVSPSDSKPAVVKRRCRFWPKCTNRNCKYVHPSQPCQADPQCSFGNSCIFVHPVDMNKINSVLSSKNAHRYKRKADIVKLNHLEGYIPHCAQQQPGQGV
ncbi:hypothetical protein LPJ78_000586 [Coemansia sp. RSA 989]|nr:hypothetical protein BX667DRAFT_500964 [Coemansia mojavensis]KAJ1744216.1 hypothetical protein LPJ68_000276 [Coemansia sp. RSA 1086]KAJ1867887.1 hypothetical protein LPJ78_000586 [Coemansia sp. RSA 989]KAJ1874440.1 hypothetical protein LPJ55_001439 [Coemansia sp. RSA 990]KAJ2633143.1 hypothetical protein H4R22_000722 [Coemansia sp. RSA 1290]KAJ2653133.1 hypothetical protein IWW40_000787 [Coemansia sp. RSA 1250]